MADDGLKRNAPIEVKQRPGACAFACLESIFRSEGIAITQTEMVAQGGEAFVEKGSYKLGVDGLQGFLSHLGVKATVRRLSINEHFPYSLGAREHVLLFSHRKGLPRNCGNHVRVYSHCVGHDFVAMDPGEGKIDTWPEAEWYQHDLEPCSITFE